MDPSGVWVLICPCDSPPHLMRMPKENVFAAVEQHLKVLAPECDSGSQHAWGIDSDFTFDYNVDSLDEYILFGVCNENGPYAKLTRNKYVSAMLEFYTGERGTFGPFAFVLARVQKVAASTDTRDAQDSNAEMHDELDDAEDEHEDEDEEIPVDIDSAWPLQRILDHWEGSLREKMRHMAADFARQGKNNTFGYF